MTLTSLERDQEQNEPIWSWSNWTVDIGSGDAATPIVRGVDLAVNNGECLAIVGESGSGKTLLTMSALQLVAEGTFKIGGETTLAGRSRSSMSERDWYRHRSRSVGVVFQDHLSSLNPIRTVGAQLVDAISSRLDIRRRDCTAQAEDMLKRVGLPDPRRQMRSFPFELSGGMRQRVMIAIALAGNPPILLADEPTTALDVTVQAQIVELVDELRSDLGLTVVWITHDLGVVARLATRVAVLYAGKVVELCDVGSFFDGPKHPYSAALLGSVAERGKNGNERLVALPGRPPYPEEIGTGCSFFPRCSVRSSDRCESDDPPLLDRGNGHLVASFCQ